MSCGLQDSLLDTNRTFKAFLEEKGVTLTYEETEGTHSWDFWNDQIQKVLAWLPLDEAKEGLHSGNVSAGSK